MCLRAAFDLRLSFRPAVFLIVVPLIHLWTAYCRLRPMAFSQTLNFVSRRCRYDSELRTRRNGSADILAKSSRPSNSIERCLWISSQLFLLELLKTSMIVRHQSELFEPLLINVPQCFMQKTTDAASSLAWRGRISPNSRAQTCPFAKNHE